MSDTWLKFVPSSPTYQPSREAAERARSLLASFVPKADEVEVRFEDS